MADRFHPAFLLILALLVVSSSTRSVIADTSGFRQKRRRLARRPRFIDGISSIYPATWVSG